MIINCFLFVVNTLLGRVPRAYVSPSVSALILSIFSGVLPAVSFSRGSIIDYDHIDLCLVQSRVALSRQNFFSEAVEKDTGVLDNIFPRLRFITVKQ